MSEHPEYNKSEGQRVDHDPQQQQLEEFGRDRTSADQNAPDLNKPKKNIFSRVKERVMEMGGSAKIRSKMAGPERFAEAYNTFKLRDHEHRVDYLDNEKRIFSSRISDLQGRLDKIDASAESVMANIGDLPADIRQKFDAEKKLLQDALEKNKALLADVEQQLTVQHEKTSQYDEKLKIIARDLRKSIEQVLAGPESRLKYLKELQLQSAKEAINFQDKITEVETALGYMPIVWDKAPSETEQQIYAEQIKELNRLLKFYKKQLAEREKTVKTSGEKTEGLERRLSYLRGKKNKYAAIEERGLTPASVLQEQKAEDEKREKIELFLSKGRYPLDRVIEEWNKLYKSKLDISGNDFKRMFGEKERAEGVNFYTFMDLISVYAREKNIKLDFDTNKFVAEMQKLPRVKEPEKHGHGHEHTHKEHAKNEKGHDKDDADKENLAEHLRYTKYDLDLLIGEWNDLYRGKLMILPNEFKHSITEQGRLDIENKGIELGYFIDIVKIYARRKKIKINFDINEFYKAVDKNIITAEVEEVPSAAPEPEPQSSEDAANHEVSGEQAHAEPDSVAHGGEDESPSQEETEPEVESESEPAGHESEVSDAVSAAPELSAETNKKYEHNVTEFVRVWNKYLSEQFNLDQDELKREASEMFDPERFKTISISQLFEVLQRMFLKKDLGNKFDEIMSRPGDRKEFLSAIKKFNKLFSENRKGLAKLERLLKGKSFKETSQLKVQQEQLYDQKFSLAYLCDKWNEGSDFKMRIDELTRPGQLLKGNNSDSAVEVGAFLDAVEEYVGEKVPVANSQVNLTYVFGRVNIEEIINFDISHNRAAARS